MATAVNSKGSYITVSDASEATVKSPITLSENTIEKLADNVMTNLSEKELKNNDDDVLCKMVIKGKASKLVNIIDQVIGTYYKSDSTYSKGFDTDLKLTFMIQEDKK